MTRLPLSRAAVLLLLAAAGCHRRPPEDPSAAPVAWVNGQVLTRAEFERELARSFELADGTSAPNPDQLAALRHTVLQAGVDRLLFVQEAAKTLATIRRLLAPNVQINVGQNQIITQTGGADLS